MTPKLKAALRTLDAGFNTPNRGAEIRAFMEAGRADELRNWRDEMSRLNPTSGAWTRKELSAWAAVIRGAELAGKIAETPRATTRSQERAQRVEVKRQIAEARKVLAAIAKSRKAAIAQIKLDCRAAKKHVRARVKAWRKLQDEIMKAADYGARAQALDDCQTAQRKAKAKAKTEAQGVLDALALHDAHLVELRRAEKPSNPRRRRGGLRAAEKAGEVYDEIKANLPAEWLTAFERFKHRPDIQRTIRGAQKPGSLRSPSEAILEYFAEHADIVHDEHRAIDADADREWKARLKELERLHRLGLPAPDEWTPREREPGDDDTPF